MLTEIQTPVENAGAPREYAVEARNVGFKYGDFEALKDISLVCNAREITALIGASGCGKSTFLRCLNRMNDMIEGTKVSGKILVEGRDIYQPGVDVAELRRDVGMVFQKPNPFPMSIYDNVAYGPRIHGIRKRSELNHIVERCLSQAALWDEVKDKLKGSAMSLSGGQQQRLCIARTIAVNPRIILMDEPCSALDPVATARIEDLMIGLREQYSIVIVTHNMQQAQRTSQYTAFFYKGQLIEMNSTSELFLRPQETLTQNYLQGKFG